VGLTVNAGASLTATPDTRDLTIAEGAVLTVNGTLNVDVLDVGGTAIVNSGGQVFVDALNIGAGDTLRLGGTVTVAGNVNNDGRIEGLGGSLVLDMSAPGGENVLNSAGVITGNVSITTINGPCTFSGVFPAGQVGTINCCGVSVCGTLLPVEWLGVQAVPASASSVQVQWQTAQETNNAFFEVQRALPGQSFSRVGVVPSSSLNGAGAAYTFTDEELAPATYLYRIRQVDLDGQSALSNTVEATLASPVPTVTVVNPTRANESILLMPSGLPAGELQVRFLDAAGRVAATNTQPLQGDAAIAVTEPALSAGVYFVQWQAGAVSGVCRLLVQ
jgi:hypothetical protein